MQLEGILLDLLNLVYYQSHSFCKECVTVAFIASRIDFNHYIAICDNYKFYKWFGNQMFQYFFGESLKYKYKYHNVKYMNFFCHLIKLKFGTFLKINLK